MKHISAKIFSFVASTFLATSAFAWTPTVEVVRDSNNVLLRVGGWTTAAEMNEMDWSTYNVKMMILNQEFDVTAAVVSLFTSGHPSVNFTFNGHFDLNIALNQYFGIQPDLYPVRLRVCKQTAFGGECADSRESLVKRKPTDPTDNATCYPDPTCATPSGSFTTYPRVLSTDGGSIAGYATVGMEVTLDKTTTITGLRAVVTNGYSTGTPNNFQTSAVFLNIHSSLTNFATSTLSGDVVNHAAGQVSHFPFGAPPISQAWRTDFLTLTLTNPITLPAGSYVFSPFSFSGPGGTQLMDIMMSTINLGSDLLVDGFTNPGNVLTISSFGGSFTTRNTAAVDITGF